MLSDAKHLLDAPTKNEQDSARQNDHPLYGGPRPMGELWRHTESPGENGNRPLMIQLLKTKNGRCFRFLNHGTNRNLSDGIPRSRRANAPLALPTVNRVLLAALNGGNALKFAEKCCG
jgi:hypothetical protein